MCVCVGRYVRVCVYVCVHVCVGVCVRMYVCTCIFWYWVMIMCYGEVLTTIKYYVPYTENI